MTTLAAIRPDDQSFVLLVHIVGASVMVGGLLTGASLIGFARGSVSLLRLGYWTLLAVALPAYVVMRIGAEWLADKQGLNEEGVPSQTWLDIGYVVADAGALLLLITLVVGGIGVYRLRDGKGHGLLKAAMVISLLILAAALVAVWAMSGKPS